MRVLIGLARPRRFVELGVYRGCSFFAALSAANDVPYKLEAIGVDTWQGDSHGGEYNGDAFYNEVLDGTRRYPAASAQLIRSTFDEAAALVENGSIDLLHIDGLHTYEAVRHDFETWLPKLSERGVVMFHDATETRDDFGVHQLWAEIRDRYPSLLFPHSHGLGVVIVGQSPPRYLARLMRMCDDKNFESLFIGLCMIAGRAYQA